MLQVFTFTSPPALAPLIPVSLYAMPPKPKFIPIKAPSVETQSVTAPTKTWASLFYDGKTQPLVQPRNHVKATTSETNNTNHDCPFKQHQAFDSDCYRMGEFLTHHAVDGRTVSLQPRGLTNQSIYCYINSILQALLACPPLYNLLDGLAEKMTLNKNRRSTPVIDGMCRFVSEFRHLPAGQRVGRRAGKSHRQNNVNGMKNALINYGTPFEASWIYRLLNGIWPNWTGERQEDAEEFLGCLLNGLNDEMKELINFVQNDTVKKVAQPIEEVIDDVEWLAKGKKTCNETTKTFFDRTPISDIFGGFLKSKIYRAGDHDTENIQPFFTLQLDIKTVNTVSEALDALVTKNRLEGIISSKTNQEVEAWQQVLLDELPVCLVLHLQCFDFKLNGCKKIIKFLEFPIDLKIDSSKDIINILDVLLLI